METKYLNKLNNPLEDCCGYTRWWWYGCAVEKDQIIKELDFMKDANIGGVELQILYPVEADNEEKGINNIPYFSKEFFEIIKFTQEECQKRNMGFDFTPGSSWPFGGPFIDTNDAMECAIPFQIDVKGPCQYKCDFTTRFTGHVCGAVMGKMVDCVMLPETVVDITSRVNVKELFGWPWGTELDEITIPEGNWKLVFFVIHLHRNKVGKPSRNAEGNVMDHCSKQAMDCFLANMVQPVSDYLGKGTIGSYFCDSIEVEGHNWSRILQDEFRIRRGYDLTPFIYALWGDMGEITQDIRYDYFLTMSELTIENFFDELTQFCHKNGSKSRIQAHGTWGDILRVYGSADIPEGETFGEHISLEVNTIHRRLAVSAGHIYNKNIISNETFTWLKRPRFTDTPEDLKAALDAVFVDGINMIVNHGYAYSPEKAGKRGWPFYASCHINHTNTWWKYYKHIGKYIQRVSSLLRTGHHFGEVAIYLPQSDIWADNLLSDLHIAMKLEEHIGRDVVDYINKAGYWVDFINDEAITELGEIENKSLNINGSSFKAIILIGCSRLPVRTALALQKFVENGGLLIASEQIPTKSCGYINRDENYKVVRDVMLTTFNEKNAVLVDDRKKSIVRVLKKNFQPDVKISENNVVGYVHRVDGNNHIYFITNISPSSTTTDITFRDRNDNFVIYNAESCLEKHVNKFEFNENSCNVGITLEPYESVFFIFSPDNNGVELTKEIKSIKTLEVKDWTISVAELEFSDNTSEPISWENYNELEHYSGEGVYEATINIKDNFSSAFISLTNLHCAATIWINGILCGDIWKRPYRLEITSGLKTGENKITIKVVNSLMNEILDTELVNEIEPTVISGWPYFGKVINDSKKARMNYEAERREQRTLMPSGISGEVTIELY